jgi:hypothetical protein
MVKVYELAGPGAGGLAFHDGVTALGIRSGVRLYRTRALDESVFIEFEGGAEKLSFSPDGRMLAAANRSAIGIAHVTLARTDKRMRRLAIEADQITSLFAGRSFIALSQSLTGFETGVIRVSLFRYWRTPRNLFLHETCEFENNSNVEVVIISEFGQGIERSVFARVVASIETEPLDPLYLDFYPNA